MANESVTIIKVDPGSELAHALEDTNARTIVLESKGTRYTVQRSDEDLWADYDPEKVRAGLERFAGMITPEQAKRMKELVYRGREEGTRPPDRP